MRDVQLLKDEPAGIGGWLILPLIGLIRGPISLLGALWVDVVPLFEAETWELLTTPASPIYSSYWAPYVIASAILSVGLSVGAIVLLVLFLRRSRRVPLLISLFYLACAAVAAFEVLSVWHLSQQVSLLAESGLADGAAANLITSLVVPAVWIPYFRLSVRVRNTFDR